MGLKHIAVILVALQVAAFARDISYESSYESVALGDEAESTEGSSEEVSLAFEPFDSTKGETADEWFDRMNADVADAYAQLKAQQRPEPTSSDLKGINQKLSDDELKRINELRALQGTPPLEFDPKIATFAQNFADKISNKIGQENDSPNGPGGAADMWFFGEIGQGKKNGNMPSSMTGAPQATGHFTRVIWDETQTIRCGRACYPINGEHCNIICNYFPTGNMGVTNDQAAILKKFGDNFNMKLNKNAQMKPRTIA